MIMSMVYKANIIFVQALQQSFFGMKFIFM